ncbi:PstS family phosphate ABC transporter substrate-binding protein [Methanimicrococcus sp. OttesenSCG-928-J09]|nr:PstS family phosphate ABC transporter substrate-binding protein [Methanimicrococcus sp. OttesenSCG-928-J09]
MKTIQNLKNIKTTFVKKETTKSTKRFPAQLPAQLTALFFILLLAFSGAGCLGQDADDKTLVLSGSTSVLPLAQSLSESYMKNDTEALISVKGGGSGTGIAELIDSSNDIAMSSRKIKDTEASNAESKGIKPIEYEIAKDGIAVIVNPANPVNNLTLEQIQKIYSGEIKNWKEVGGEDAQIAVIARDSASGTQEFFTEAVMGDVSYRSDLITQSATGAVTQEVSRNTKAIGFIGAAYQGNSIKTVGIKIGETTVMPTEENILSETYPLSRGLYFYADQDVKQIADDFITFVLSPEGQKIVRETGYAPVKNT